MHQVLRDNTEVFKLYAKYVVSTAHNHPEAYLFPFPEIYDNVVNGLCQNSDLQSEYVLDNLKVVLKSMVYTSSDSIQNILDKTKK